MRGICFIAFLLLGLQSCVSGALYQDITTPYMLDMNRTPVGLAMGRSSAYRLQEPFSGASISVEWNSYGLGDAHRKGRLEQTFIADLREESAFFGVWRRNTLILNGSRYILDDDL